MTHEGLWVMGYCILKHQRIFIYRKETFYTDYQDQKDGGGWENGQKLSSHIHFTYTCCLDEYQERAEL